MAVVSRFLGGEVGAAEELRGLWSETAPAWERCVVAHYAADTFGDPATALIWDDRALAAAEQIDRRTPGPFGLEADAMLPSLHLNLAENHRRLGDVAAATEHLRQGRLQLDRLDADGYGNLIRSGLDRLQERLRSAEPQPEGSPRHRPD